MIGVHKFDDDDPQTIGQIAFLADTADNLRRQNALCGICGGEFTDDEWDDRHATSGGLDCHAVCCDVCECKWELMRLTNRYGRPFTDSREVAGSCNNPTNDELAQAEEAKKCQ